MAPPSFDLIQFVRDGGQYCAVLELLAIGFFLADRRRLLATLKAKDAENRVMTERILTVATELKMYLFNERRA